MMNDETIRLVLEMTGSASIQEATDKLQAMKTTTTELAGSQGALKTSVESTTSAHGDMGRGVLQASYAVQDFTSVLSGGGGLTRALSSVQNNIPVLLTGLGVGAGLAGTISLVSVGIGAAIPLLETFMGHMDAEKLKRSAEQMKELADQAERMKSIKAPEEVTKAKDVTDLVAKAGNLQTWEGIESTLRASGFGGDEKDKAMTAKIQGMRARGEWVEPALVREEQEIGKRQEKAIKDEADRLLVQLPISKEARQTVAGMATRKPALFGAGFGEALAFYDDEGAQKASQEADDKLDQDEAERQGKKTARFEAAKQKNEREKEWNRSVATQDTMIRQMEREEEAETKHRAAERFQLEQKAEREAEHAATKAKHEAEKHARENTPEAINRRQKEALDNEAMGYVQRAMPGAMPGPQAAVAKHMVENYQAGKALGHTIQEQIDYAVMQTRTEMINGMNAGLKRSGQQTESRISP